MTTNLDRILPLSVALGLTSIASAQIPTNVTTNVTTRSASYDRDFGTSQWGGNIAMDSSAERRVTSIGPVAYSASMRLDDSIVGRVRLDGTNREAAAVSSYGQVGGGLSSIGVTRTFAAGFALRVAGNTVLAPSFGGTSTDQIAWSSGTNTVTFLDTTIPVDVGPVPVQVRLEAEARSSIDAVLSVNPPQLSVTLTGNLRGVATGEATVSTNFVVAEIGVISTLDLLNTRISPSHTTSFTSGPSGSFSYRVEAARFRVRPYVSLWTLIAGWQTFYVTLVDETWGVITGTRTLL